MSNNINRNQVFNQITELQKSLESIDKFLFKIQCVTDSQSYVEQEDTREVIDIVKLNEEIERIVAREQVLRAEIAKIIVELEG